MSLTKMRKIPSYPPSIAPFEKKFREFHDFLVQTEKKQSKLTKSKN